MTKKSQRTRKAHPIRATANGDKTPSLTTEQQFQQEYAYVIKDLRTIFILAAVMFTLLIVLNIVLR